MDEDDEALLDAWRTGDMSAGQELYRRYFPVVYRYFSSKLGEDVEDLVQCTFLACTGHRLRIRSNASFRAFLLVVARNEFYTYLQRRYRLDNSVDVTTTSLQDLGVTASQLIAIRDEHRLLVLALRRIPIELQELVELHYFEQLSGRELACALELPEGTVRSRLRRAIAALRAELDTMARSPAQVDTTLASISQWADRVRSRHALGAAE